VRPDTLVVTDTDDGVEPVSLAQAKAQLGMMPEQTDFDALLAGQIATAREFLEARLGRSLVLKKYRAKWKNPAGRKFALPRPPLVVDETHAMVVSVDGDELAGSEYEAEADAMPAYVEFDAAPQGELVVEWWAGPTAGRPVSQKLRSAILLYVVHLFENRGILAAGSSVELPQAFEALLASESHTGGW
jgi:uncharacterized phiE125 gp8 family phage protein